MDDRQINWIIGFAAALGAVVTVASIPLMMRTWFTVSVALGAIIAVGNLWLIRRMVRRAINATVAGSAKATGFMVKFGLLAAAIGLTFKFVPIEPLGFMLGFGVLVFAAVLGPFFAPDPHGDQSAAPSE